MTVMRECPNASGIVTCYGSSHIKANMKTQTLAWFIIRMNTIPPSSHCISPKYIKKISILVNLLQVFRRGTEVWTFSIYYHHHYCHIILRHTRTRRTVCQTSQKVNRVHFDTVPVTAYELYVSASLHLSNIHFTPSGSLDPLASSSLHCITKYSHFGSRRARDRALVTSRPHSYHWVCNETMDFPSESWH